MRLTGIDIHQLPGIDPVQLNDFHAGINFIVGPNAIGKSSLIRALQYLLGEPRPGDPPALSIAARFSDGTRRWEAQRNGPYRRWLCDGEQVESPPLPTADALHCYWLQAETLISPDDESEARLSRRLREALAGGIDLERVRDEAGLAPATFPQNERRAWQAARSRREDTERSYRSLDQQRQRLPELQQSLDDARAAQSGMARLRQTRQLREAIDGRRALEAHLARFPAVLEGLQGNEGERVDQHTRDIQALQQEIQVLEQEQGQLQAALKATGLADGRPERSLLSECRIRLDELRSTEQSRRHTAEALAATQAECNHASMALNSDSESLPLFDPQHIEALGEALRAYREVRYWQARTETPEPRKGDRTTLRLTATAAAGGVLGLLAGILTGDPLTLAAGGIATIAATGAAIRAYAHPRPGDRNVSTAVAEARAHLDELRRESGLQHLDCEDLGLERFMDLVRQLDTTRSTVEREAARLAEQDQQIQRMQGQLRERLATWTHIATPDTATLQTALESLAEQLDQARELETKLDERSRRHQRLSADLDGRRTAQAKIYEQAELPVDDRTGLAARLEAHGEFTETRRKLDQARFAEKQLRAPLEEHPSLVEWTERTDPAEIDEAIDRQAEKADRVEDLAREITALTAEVERAGGDDALASAIAEENTLVESLAEKRAARMQADLGDWLLAEVEADYRARHEPGLIRDARRRFEQFTQHQWSLEVDDNHQPVARDLRQDIPRPLTALSSGTRMQLLLAARIAWARDQEGNGPPLPLALDEALTNTDADRFGAVAHNLSTLANSEGRQILYLTARREDMALWAQTTGHRPHCIDLGAIRGASEQSTALASVELPDRPPAPAEIEPAEYARLLQVPAVDPRTDAGAIHLFHLLRDELETLHELISDWRLSHLGPLAAWLDTPAGRECHARMDAGATLSDRIVIARAWHELARQGLGRPVDRGVLIAAGAFSDRMVERVQERAEALNGDAEALVTALRNREVARVQQDHVDQLEGWLLEHGHLDRRPRLTSDAMTRQLLDRLGHRADPDLIQRISTWLAAGSEGLV
ncbi:ATP-binding protein [Spiribacter insolitus]|uniref:AAA family ATPase n=1 Tax=Spiribacter insolitus TaxID=3122417 RepID=A0ABV3T6A3_9GAMM